MRGPALNQEGPQDSVKFLLNSKNSRGVGFENSRENSRGGKIREFEREFEGGVGFEKNSRENLSGG